MLLDSAESGDAKDVSQGLVNRREVGSVQRPAWTKGAVAPSPGADRGERRRASGGHARCQSRKTTLPSRGEVDRAPLLITATITSGPPL